MSLVAPIPVIESNKKIPFVGNPSPIQMSPGLKMPELTSPQHFASFEELTNRSPLPTVNRERSVMKGNIAAGVGAGSAFQPIGTEDFFSLENLLQMGAGAGLGFVVGGGPAGALAGLLTTGLNAFLSSRAQKRKNSQLKKLQQAAEKSRREQMAREEKWRQEDRRDSLRSETYNREVNALQSKWNAYNTMSQSFMNLINNNSELKRRFAREGF